MSPERPVPGRTGGGGRGRWLFAVLVTVGVAAAVVAGCGGLTSMPLLLDYVGFPAVGAPATVAGVADSSDGWLACLVMSRLAHGSVVVWLPVMVAVAAAAWAGLVVAAGRGTDVCAVVVVAGVCGPWTLTHVLAGQVFAVSAVAVAVASVAVAARWLCAGDVRSAVAVLAGGVLVAGSLSVAVGVVAGMVGVAVAAVAVRGWPAVASVLVVVASVGVSVAGASVLFAFGVPLPGSGQVFADSGGLVEALSGGAFFAPAYRLPFAFLVTGACVTCALTAGALMRAWSRRVDGRVPVRRRLFRLACCGVAAGCVWSVAACAGPTFMAAGVFRDPSKAFVLVLVCAGLAVVSADDVRLWRGRSPVSVTAAGCVVMLVCCCVFSQVSGVVAGVPGSWVAAEEAMDAGDGDGVAGSVLMVPQGVYQRTSAAARVTASPFAFVWDRPVFVAGSGGASSVGARVARLVAAGQFAAAAAVTGSSWVAVTYADGNGRQAGGGQAGLTRRFVSDDVVVFAVDRSAAAAELSWFGVWSFSGSGSAVVPVDPDVVACQRCRVVDGVVVLDDGGVATVAGFSVLVMVQLLVCVAVVGCVVVVWRTRRRFARVAPVDPRK